MRNLVLAASAGLLLAIGATAACADQLLRPAIDGIGNAEPPLVEAGSGSPPGVTPEDFLPGFGQSAPAGRGRVIVDSGPAPAAAGHSAHRMMWEISR